MKISKSRTIQIKQYEPMMVTVEDECDAEALQASNEQLDTFMKKEVEKMEQIREGLK